jgi:hypothetical protein
VIENFDSTGLLEPQIEHAKRLTESLLNNGIALDMSLGGTGKTYTACSILRYLKSPFVVICPKLVIPQWSNVLNEFGLNPEVIIGFEKLARGNTKYYKWVSKNSYKKLHGLKTEDEIQLFATAKFTFPKHWIVVGDEAHKCKGVESSNSGLLFNLKRQGYKMLLLSATMAATPMDMRALGFATGLHDGSMRDFKRFQIESGGEWLGKWGVIRFNPDNVESVEKLKLIHDKFFHEKKIASRLTRNEFGDIFPSVQLDAESYDLGAVSNKIQSLYDEMEYELARLEERVSNYSQHILAVITATRRKIELLKTPSIVEMSADMRREGNSVILFLNYTDSIDAAYLRLNDEFAGQVGKLYGGQSESQNHQDIDDFNSGKKKFLVANLHKGGQSVNLHDLTGNHPRCSIINPSYSAISTLQSQWRTDRANAKSPVYIRYVFAAKSIEEQVCKRFQDKKDHIDLLNDRDLVPSQRIFNMANGMNI